MSNRNSLFLLIFIIFNSTLLFAQTKLVNNINMKVDSLIISLDTLKNSDKEKAYKAYKWIAENNEYSIEMMTATQQYSSVNELVDYILENNKGVCQHFSELFTAICNRMNIETYTVSGYTKNFEGKIEKLPHAWNIIKIDNVFHFVDVTWGNGFLDQHNKYHKQLNDIFFMPDYKDFSKNHMPFDPIWQLSYYPISNKDFEDSNFQNQNQNFNFIDSIHYHLKLSELDKLKNENRRIASIGVSNKLIMDKIVQNDNNIAQYNIVNQYNTFNQIVDSINKGVEFYNYYISHKNTQFKKINDNNLEILKNNFYNIFFLTNLRLNSLITSDDKLKNEIINIKKKMPTYINNAQSEKLFVEKYLSKLKVARPFMFLK